MLTIFGKKKKDEAEDTKTDTPAQSGLISSSPTPSPTPPVPATPALTPSPTQATPSMTTPSKPAQNPPQQSQPLPTASPPQPVFRQPPNAPLPAEETSLTKLLQSLLQDIPLDVVSSFGTPQSTPEYVPVRSTPPSRAMIIGPGKDSDEDWEEEGEEKPVKPPVPPASGKPAKPDIQPPTGKVPAPTPAVTPKKDQLPEKAPEKPSKVEKQPEKPAPPPKKEPRAPQSFDHIFQLTQGNLENTGLVIINGAAGSGRTTLCSGLTSNYMKLGNPCLYLTNDQSPSELRDQMKKLGTDAAQYESSFRFIIVDGFAAQSESFSMEMYYVDQPFNFDNITEALVRNSGMFVGEKVRVILDSLDNLVAKVPAKDFAKSFTDLTSKLRESGATFVVTIDMSKLPKDVAGSLNDLADCVVDLSKDDSDPNGRELKVQRLNHSDAKVEAETFEIDASKGLVFV